MGRWAGLAERRHLIAALLFFAVVLARLPFATTHLWAWDSVLYARALEVGFHVDADPGASRPHPPGYIWYVAAAQLLRAFTGESNAAYVLLSILASAAGAALLWLIASRWMRPGTALVLTLAYAASPLVWTYSEIAYPYTMLALVSLALGALLIEGRWPLLASLLLGVLSGARQDVLFLLAPLWIWSMWGLGLRRVAAASTLTAAGVLSWWIPSAVLSDGPVAYLGALMRQTDSVVSTYSVPMNGPAALAYNVAFTLEALGWGLGLLALPIVLGLGRAGVRAWQRRTVPRDHVRTGLLLWALPGIVVFTLIHIGEWGHVLSVVPPLFLASGLLIDGVRSVRSARRWLAAGAAAVILPASAFLSGDAAYAAAAGPAEFSAVALARHDTGLRERIRYVRRHFNSSGTVVLAREDYQLVRYYMPEYRAWYWDPDPHQVRSAKKKRAMRPTTVVVFTAGLQPLIATESHRIEIAPGIELSTFPLERGNVLELQGERYVVREAPGR
ncbi:MAG: hypothetical protein HYU87_07135 [Chloroflexi bacterium]|nr:hypothetical protein [Chloroflexota bacterium]